MDFQLLRKLLITPVVIFGLIVTGCFNEQPVTNTGLPVNITPESGDPRINFLVAESGVPRELVSVVYDSISKDTGYILEQRITPQQRERGLRGTGVGFKAKEVDKLMRARAESENEPNASEKSAAIIPPMAATNLLAKTAHTRWDHWYAPIDVKKLTEVHQVRVFIHQTGPARLGPNWTAGVRSAIANWNAQAKGTTVTFVETTDINMHDVSFRGSFGIGSDGTLTSSAFLTADQYMNPDGISLWVNTGYESAATPHNQKTTVAMSLLALSTNITFTGMEGYYWNDGASIHIPGTPATDGDGLTANSSILTYGTSSVSTPVMTAGDLRAFRTIYPAHGVTGIHSVNNSLYMVTKRGHTLIDANVKSFYASTDTVIYARHDGKLYRRVGLAGAYNVQLWPGTGSVGNVEEFLYSEGYLAVRTATGKIYTRTPTGNWIVQDMHQSYNSSDFRLDGNLVVVRNQSHTQLKSFVLGGTSASTPTVVYNNMYGTINDWAIRNGVLVVVDNGSVWGNDNNAGWNQIHAASAGWAYNVVLSDQLMVMYYLPNGSSDNSFAVRFGGVYGWTGYYTDPITSNEDIALCDNNVAFLQSSAHLRVIDYTNWFVYAHYTMPTGGPFTKVNLTGVNCDFVTTISPTGPRLHAKYGMDYDNQYQGYMPLIYRLTQSTVPHQ